MGESAAITEAERSTGGYARYVGRVGGLAFALGVGAAVLAGAGAASADTSDSGGASSSTSDASSSDTSSSDTSSSDTDAGPRSKRSSETTQESETASESDATDDAETETDADDADDTDDADETDETEIEPEEQEGEPSSPAAEDTDAPAGSRAADVEEPASTQSMSVAPAAAVEPSPWERFFENETPTLGYNPAENTTIEGRIEGDLHPEDGDSTQLTYTATRPDHGTVVINPDGTFVYTPGASYAGQDRFDVTVSDARSGFHIHGFAGLLNLLSFGILGNSGHRTTETVFIGFERAVVASGLNSPVDFRFLPDGRVIVAEKAGAIRIVENGAAGAPLITLSVATLGERGVSGLAVDPDFADNGHLYVAYTTSALRNRLSQLTVVGNAAGSEVVLLESTVSAALNHQGGALGFGPDGTLYWGLGDNGSGANSQDLTNLHGKILRINPDGSVPSDNPAVSGARAEIFAYGLRNPFRLAFTPSGALLVADVGAASFEEVNLVTAGGNYGWPGAEGVCASCTSIDPIYTYPRGSGAAITSVLVYDGTTFGPAYQNKVFIADLVQGWIKVLTCTPEFTSCGNPEDFDLQAGTTLGLLQGPDGNVYQLTYSGSLVRIAPAGTSSV